jgi:Recombinase
MSRHILTKEARAKGLRTRQLRADRQAATLAHIIAELRAAGTASQRSIAKALNERGIPTPRGKNWDATAVRRLLKRLSAG